MLQTNRVLRLPMGVFVLAIHRLGTIVVQPGEVHMFEASFGEQHGAGNRIHLSLGGRSLIFQFFVTPGK